MLVKSITAFAALTFAAGVAAEPMPYKPNAMKMSTRDLFGVVRRHDTPGYQPEQAACGAGSTCEEACGAGYTTCASSDSKIHCFNPTVGEVCCPNKSGSTCEAGYYCTEDQDGETWCCPEEMDLEACAAEYNVPGGLVSQTAPPETTTSVSSTSTSTSEPPTTTTTAEEETTSSSIAVEQNTTSVDIGTTTSSPTAPSLTTSSASFVPSLSLVPSNTTTISTVNTPAPTQTKIAEGAGSVVAPASALVLLAAGIAALL